MGKQDQRSIAGPSELQNSEYHSPSIKIEDFKINTYNPFNPISTKGGGVNILNLLLQMSYNMQGC